jgi:hypothetical protein
MAATDRFRKQHAELFALVRHIEPWLDPKRVAGDADMVRALVSALISRLSMHIAAEDNTLYPGLVQHADATVRDTARRFVGEMAGVRPAVEAYNRKWGEREIAADAVGFCAETRMVFSLLADCFSRENAELYPMVDELAGVPA